MYARFGSALFCLTLWFGSTLSPIARTVAAADHIKAVVPAPQTQAWWFERHARVVARIQQSPVDLLFIGDSITQGWEEAGRQVWETFYGRRRAANLGFNGDQTDNVLWRLQHGELDDIAPKLAIVMIGTNNTAVRKEPPEQTAAEIETILTTLRTRLPQTKILLLAVFPRGWSANDPLRLVNQSVNERLPAYADQRQVLFLDLGPHFLDKAGRLSEEVMPDALHLSERGYRLWAEGMEHLIKPLLGE